MNRMLDMVVVEIDHGLPDPALAWVVGLLVNDTKSEEGDPVPQSDTEGVAYTIVRGVETIGLGQTDRPGETPKDYLPGIPKLEDTPENFKRLKDHAMHLVQMRITSLYGILGVPLDTRADD